MMERPGFKLFLIIFPLCALAGWISAASDPTEASTRSDAWGGQGLISSTSQSASYDKILKFISASRILPQSSEVDEGARDIDLTDPTQDPDNPLYIPPFPEIISASIVDGKPQIHMKEPDGTITLAGVSDTLDSGWVLKTVDLERVIAVFEDTEETFEIGYDTLLPTSEDSNVSSEGP